MKTFKKLINEVAAARSQSDKDFMALHQIHVVDPVGYGKQLPKNDKTSPRRADPKTSGQTRETAAIQKADQEQRPQKHVDALTGDFTMGDAANDDDDDDHPDRVDTTGAEPNFAVPQAFGALFGEETAIAEPNLSSLWHDHAALMKAKNSSSDRKANAILQHVKEKHGQQVADEMRAHSVCHSLGLDAMCHQLRKNNGINEEVIDERESAAEDQRAREKLNLDHRPKLDELSNLWRVYAKNHCAEPYTSREHEHNRGIYNHVYKKYGKECADDMHHHAHAMATGHIMDLRTKHGIMEGQILKSKGFISDQERNELTKNAQFWGKDRATGEDHYRGKDGKIFSLRKMPEDNKHQLRIQEEIDPKNKKYGFQGVLGEKASAFLSRAAAHIRNAAGGNISDEEVNHYLDSAHGRHLAEMMSKNVGPTSINKSIRQRLPEWKSSYDPEKFEQLGEQLDESVGHRFLMSVSDPNHSSVSLRKEKIQRHINVKGETDIEKAKERAIKHYRKLGFKVHDAEHVGEIKEETASSESAKHHDEMAQHHFDETGKVLNKMREDPAFRRAHNDLLQANPNDAHDLITKHDKFIKARDAHPLAKQLLHHEKEFVHHQQILDMGLHETAAGVPVPGAASADGALKYVKKVGDKWALVSRHSGKPLRYYPGTGKPSEEWASKALRGIEYYKHGGNTNEEVLDEGGLPFDKDPRPYYYYKTQSRFGDARFHVKNLHDYDFQVIDEHDNVDAAKKHVDALNKAHREKHNLSEEVIMEARKGLPNLKKWNHQTAPDGYSSYSHQNGSTVFTISKKKDDKHHTAYAHFGDKPSYLVGHFDTPEKAHSAIKRANKTYHFYAEEVLNELSPQKLADYIERSQTDRARSTHKIGEINGVALTTGTNAQDREERDIHNKRQLKRQIGLHNALKRLKKRAEEAKQ